MRLDDLGNDLDVEDQRGSGGGFGMPMGGGGGLPLGRGGIGCGGILLLIVISLVLGVNPLQLLGGIDDGSPTTQVAPHARGGTNAAESCGIDQSSAFACHAMVSVNQTWAKLIQGYTRPKLVFYSRQGQSGCGAAQSAMGPFYCPADQGVYLDTEFFSELKNRFGAPGDFAQAYVIAHEVGHHVQNLTGISDQVSRQQQRVGRVAGNALSVKLELQADCYAGVWAAQNKDRMDPGDIEEGMRAAQAIGDDTLQKQSQGVAVPESFTHGTSAQRQFWLKRGLDSGDPRQCDTFNSSNS